MLHYDAIPEPVKVLLGRVAPLAAARGFALGGGTSLALRLGHRISVDLDWFTTDPFSPDVLAEDPALEGVTILGKAPGSLSMDCGGVKIDWLRHAYPLLQPGETLDEIALLALPDVAAMKLNAIANRGAKKDFYDVAELLAVHPLEKLLDWFSARYRNSDPFAVIRSLAWFEDAEPEPDPVSLRGLSWNEVKEQVRLALSELA